MQNSTNSDDAAQPIEKIDDSWILLANNGNTVPNGATLSPEQMHCRRCNNIIYRDVITCPHCGLALKEKKVRFWSAFWIALLLVGIISSILTGQLWPAALGVVFLIYEFNHLFFYKDLKS